jgi:hypothetical protein
MWTSLIGKLNGADHWPLTEAPPPEEPPLETLTLITLVVWLPAASRATALSACDPSVADTVFQETE